MLDFSFIRRGEPVLFRCIHCFRAVVELAGKLGEIYISPRTPVRLRGEDDRGWASLQLTRQAGGRKLRFATMGVRSSLGRAGSAELKRNQVREARAVQLDALNRGPRSVPSFALFWREFRLFQAKRAMSNPIFLVSNIDIRPDGLSSVGMLRKGVRARFPPSLSGGANSRSFKRKWLYEIQYFGFLISLFVRTTCRAR